jgi:bifunctional N-acetylglucosamine-1-phosphate-uridyltransferase/glucosamine-1-phosphate-acetyltransferase GlmU-like protein
MKQSAKQREKPVMEQTPPLVAIILAAGKSTRMQMKPKSALPLAGKPVAQWALSAVKETRPQEIIVIVGHEAEAVKNAFGPECKFVLQEPQLGTGHALLICERLLKDFVGDLLVIFGDHPLISGQDLQNLVAYHRQNKPATTMLTWLRKGESSFGRILRDENSKVLGIIEVPDASPQQLAIREVNLSMYCFPCPAIFDVLHHIRADNKKQEYYLTDVVGLLVQEGKRVEAFTAQHPGTAFGINTPEEFARAEAFLLKNTPLEQV